MPEQQLKACCSRSWGEGYNDGFAEAMKRLAADAYPHKKACHWCSDTTPHVHSYGDIARIASGREREHGLQPCPMCHDPGCTSTAHRYQTSANVDKAIASIEERQAHGLQVTPDPTEPSALAGPRTEERLPASCPECGAPERTTGMLPADGAHRFECGAKYRTKLAIREGRPDNPCPRSEGRLKAHDDAACPEVGLDARTGRTQPQNHTNTPTQPVREEPPNGNTP